MNVNDTLARLDRLDASLAQFAAENRAPVRPRRRRRRKEKRQGPLMPGETKVKKTKVPKAPKKRGRPRLPPSQNVKRPRGRPKKPPALYPRPAGPAKKRGRPKKPAALYPRPAGPQPQRMTVEQLKDRLKSYNRANPGGKVKITGSKAMLLGRLRRIQRGELDATDMRGGKAPALYARPAGPRRRPGRPAALGVPAMVQDEMRRIGAPQYDREEHVEIGSGTNVVRRRRGRPRLPPSQNVKRRRGRPRKEPELPSSSRFV